MLTIVIDRIDGQGGSAILIEQLAGIGIHIKTREIAARDVKVHAVSLGEDQRCGIQLNLESIDVARNHEGWLFERVSVPCAHDAVGDVEFYTFGKIFIGRINVDYFRGEIAVHGAGRAMAAI